MSVALPWVCRRFDVCTMLLTRATVTVTTTTETVEVVVANVAEAVFTAVEICLRSLKMFLAMMFPRFAAQHHFAV